eukprot:918917_1
MPVPPKIVRVEHDGSEVKWSVCCGDSVNSGDKLGTYMATQPLLPRPELTDITAEWSGQIIEILANEQSHVVAGDSVAKIKEAHFPQVESPLEPDVMMIDQPSSSPVSNGYGKRSRIMTEDDRTEICRLLAQGLHDSHKLMLVLDIDHTLLHATKNPQAKLIYSEPEMAKDVFLINFEANDRVTPYYIKLRPDLAHFLESLQNHFQIALYTMGLRPYALKVMEAIDPNDSIIQGRAVCRDDHSDASTKSLQRLFPCDESMVLVVDDRTDVWETPQNVMKAFKFHFWPQVSQDSSGVDATAEKDELLSPGERPLDSKFDLNSLSKRNEDNCLSVVCSVLHAVHSLYFKHQDRLNGDGKQDVTVLLAMIQRGVLKGCHILFSGVWPHSAVAQDQDAWRLAEQFGAICHTKQNPVITHCIARRLATAKVTWATSNPKIHVVHVNWLHQSVLDYSRAVESKFRVPVTGQDRDATPVSPYTARPVMTNELVRNVLTSGMEARKDLVVLPKVKPPRQPKPGPYRYKSKKLERENLSGFQYKARRPGAGRKATAPPLPEAPLATEMPISPSMMPFMSSLIPTSSSSSVKPASSSNVMPTLPSNLRPTSSSSFVPTSSSSRIQVSSSSVMSTSPSNMMPTSPRNMVSVPSQSSMSDISPAITQSVASTDTPKSFSNSVPNSTFPVQMSVSSNSNLARPSQGNLSRSRTFSPPSETMNTSCMEPSPMQLDQRSVSVPISNDNSLANTDSRPRAESVPEPTVPSDAITNHRSPPSTSLATQNPISAPIQPERSDTTSTINVVPHVAPAVVPTVAPTVAPAVAPILVSNDVGSLAKIAAKPVINSQPSKSKTVPLATPVSMEIQPSSSSPPLGPSSLMSVSGEILSAPTSSGAVAPSGPSQAAPNAKKLAPTEKLAPSPQLVPSDPRMQRNIQQPVVAQPSVVSQHSEQIPLYLQTPPPLEYGPSTSPRHSSSPVIQEPVPTDPRQRMQPVGTKPAVTLELGANLEPSPSPTVPKQSLSIAKENFPLDPAEDVSDPDIPVDPRQKSQKSLNIPMKVGAHALGQPQDPRVRRRVPFQHLPFMPAHHPSYVGPPRGDYAGQPFGGHVGPPPGDQFGRGPSPSGDQRFIARQQNGHAPPGHLMSLPAPQFSGPYRGRGQFDRPPYGGPPRGGPPHGRQPHGGHVYGAPRDGGQHRELEPPFSERHGGPDQFLYRQNDTNNLSPDQSANRSQPRDIQQPRDINFPGAPYHDGEPPQGGPPDGGPLRPDRIPLSHSGPPAQYPDPRIRSQSFEGSRPPTINGPPQNAGQDAQQARVYPRVFAMRGRRGRGRGGPRGTGPGRPMGPVSSEVHSSGGSINTSVPIGSKGNLPQIPAGVDTVIRARKASDSESLLGSQSDMDLDTSDLSEVPPSPLNTKRPGKRSRTISTPEDEASKRSKHADSGEFDQLLSAHINPKIAASKPVAGQGNLVQITTAPQLLNPAASQAIAHPQPKPPTIAVQVPINDAQKPLPDASKASGKRQRYHDRREERRKRDRKRRKGSSAPLDIIDLSDDTPEKRSRSRERHAKSRDRSSRRHGHKRSSHKHRVRSSSRDRRSKSKSKSKPKVKVVSVSAAGKTPVSEKASVSEKTVVSEKMLVPEKIVGSEKAAVSEKVLGSDIIIKAAMSDKASMNGDNPPIIVIPSSSSGPSGAVVSQENSGTSELTISSSSSVVVDSKGSKDGSEKEIAGKSAENQKTSKKPLEDGEELEDGELSDVELSATDEDLLRSASRSISKSSRSYSRSYSRSASRSPTSHRRSKRKEKHRSSHRKSRKSSKKSRKSDKHSHSHGSRIIPVDNHGIPSLQELRDKNKGRQMTVKRLPIVSASGPRETPPSIRIQTPVVKSPFQPHNIGAVGLGQQQPLRHPSQVTPMGDPKLLQMHQGDPKLLQMHQPHDPAVVSGGSLHPHVMPPAGVHQTAPQQHMNVHPGSVPQGMFMSNQMPAGQGVEHGH